MGLDLAWGRRGRTGGAVVDDSGALLDSATLGSDDDIVAWLDRASGAPVTIAVDAPLVVTTAAGQRPCERDVSRAFGRFGASCHSANLGMPHMNPPRAAVLASRMGWNVDPGHVGRPAQPGCIEVYPHPAMVSLFGLARVLPYKAGRGRPVDARRCAFTTLMDHMAGLSVLALDSSPRWAELRAVVESAERQVDLERVEDEIDAIFCAHLAWLWHRAPGALRVYGDSATGFIVAPPPPPRVPPAGAEPPARDCAVAVHDPRAGPPRAGAGRGVAVSARAG